MLPRGFFSINFVSIYEDLNIKICLNKAFSPGIEEVMPPKKASKSVCQVLYGNEALTLSF